jgi:hypothetical protein
LGSGLLLGNRPNQGQNHGLTLIFAVSLRNPETSASTETATSPARKPGLGHEPDLMLHNMLDVVETQTPSSSSSMFVNFCCELKLSTIIRIVIKKT